MIVRESFVLSPANTYLPTGKCIKDELTSDGAFPGNAPDVLLVKVAGTHGGFVNHNGFFYKQSGMEVAYHTWTRPYQKAVLVNHDEHGDSIGRVIESRFTLDDPDFYRVNFGATEKNLPTCHIDLILSITDKRSIEKILRGEFRTVSQSSLCRDINCSVCGADILSDERCDHMRNSKVDGNRVHWIFGPLTYKELSFVNVPSDEYATIEKIGLEKEEVADSWPSESKESYGTLVIMDSFEETSMAKNKPNIPEPDDEFSSEDIKMFKQLDTEVDLFLDTLYAMLPDTFADKKLSAAERKALPASAFCGPERSFPVNDCGHVMAAKARLKGYKGTGSKTKILVCINAAAKRMKCFKEEDEYTLDGFLAAVGLCDSVMSKSSHDEITKALRDELEAKIKTIETEKASATDSVKALESQEIEHLAVHIADLRQAMGSVKEPEQHTAMVEEMKGRTRDSLNDTLTDLRKEIGARELKPVVDPATGKTKDEVPEGKKRATEFATRDDAVNHLFFGPKDQEK